MEASEEIVLEAKVAAEWEETANGRVNLIGEHIDYQGGTVCPVAINRQLTLRASSSPSGRSVESNQGTGEPLAANALSWLENQYRTELPGLRIQIDSSIPVGSGLSSSAALLVALIRLFSRVTGVRIADEEIPCIVQTIEHEVRGVACGLMDPTAIVFAQAGHVMRYHPATGHRTYVPFPDGARVLVFDTQTPRSLSSTDYNRCVKVAERTAEKLGLNKLSEYRPGGEHLLTEEEARVLAHHTGESRRVDTFLKALADKDLIAAGKAMIESHQSLRDNLRVSCPELESFVEFAIQHDSVYGARLTGAGFGGCAIALVDARHATTVSQSIQSQFQERHQKGEGWVSEICGTGATAP